MRLLSVILVYALTLAPVAVLANFVSKSAVAQIVSSFEQVVKALKTLN